MVIQLYKFGDITFSATLKKKKNQFVSAQETQICAVQRLADTVLRGLVQ